MTTAVFCLHFILPEHLKGNLIKSLIKMESVPEEKYVFDAQWYQSEASVTRDFILNFYIEDNSLELVKNLKFKNQQNCSKINLRLIQDRFKGQKSLPKTYPSGYSLCQRPLSWCLDICVWPEDPCHRLWQPGDETAIGQQIAKVINF